MLSPSLIQSVMSVYDTNVSWTINIVVTTLMMGCCLYNLTQFSSFLLLSPPSSWTTVKVLLIVLTFATVCVVFATLGPFFPLVWRESCPAAATANLAGKVFILATITEGLEIFGCNFRVFAIAPSPGAFSAVDARFILPREGFYVLRAFD